MKKHKQRNKFLLIILSFFVLGTSIDIFTMLVFQLAVGGLGAILAALTGIILMYKYRNERFSFRSFLQLLRLSRPHFTSVFDVVFVVAVLIATAISLYVVSIHASHPSITPALLVYGLSAAIVPPTIEEFIDRGFIQSSLERMQFSVPLVIVISAILFSLSHIPVNVGVVPLALISGLCFGLITIRTRSIILPFIIHGLWNLGIVLLIS